MTITSPDNTEALPPHTTSPILTSNRHSHWSIWVITFALMLLILGCGCYAFYFQQQVHQQQTKLQQQINTLQQQIQTQQQTNEQVQQQLNQSINALQARLQTELLQRHAQADRWLLLTARYYLELATINAHWRDNPSITIALLQQADQLLSQVHDQRMLSIRQAIAKDIAINTQIKPIDMTGLLSQLDALQHTVASLPFKKSIALTPQNTTAMPKANNAATGWRARLYTSLEQLKKLVVIRHHDDAIEPLLTPTYEAMLRENIRLNLQAAQWAVLQQNQQIYALSLQQALENIKRGFDEGRSSVQAIQTQLQTLIASSVIQQRPALQTALPLLNTLLETPAPAPKSMEEQL